MRTEFSQVMDDALLLLQQVYYASGEMLLCKNMDSFHTNYCILKLIQDDISFLTVEKSKISSKTKLFNQ